MKNYHEVIFKEYLRRRSINEKYNQKEFAADLGIGYELLVKVLKGEKGLSKVNAYIVGRRLGLSLNDAKEFRFLVSAQSGRSKNERNLAKQWLKNGSNKSDKRLHSAIS